MIQLFKHLAPGRTCTTFRNVKQS